MDFIKSLLLGEFNFIIPISYIIAGTVLAVFIFAVRYILYTRRKKAYAKRVATSQKTQLEEHSQLVKEENGQAVQETMI